MLRYRSICPDATEAQEHFNFVVNVFMLASHPGHYRPMIVEVVRENNGRDILPGRLEQGMKSLYPANQVQVPLITVLAHGIVRRSDPVVLSRRLLAP